MKKFFVIFFSIIRGTIGLPIHRKKKDKKIAQAKKLMQEGEFAQAELILFELQNIFCDLDREYRLTEIDQMYFACRKGQCYPENESF